MYLWLANLCCTIFIGYNIFFNLQVHNDQTYGSLVYAKSYINHFNQGDAHLTEDEISLEECTFAPVKFFLCIHS